MNPQNLLDHADVKNAYFGGKYYKSLLFLSVTNGIYNEIHKIFVCVPTFLLDKLIYLFIYFYLFIYLFIHLFFLHNVEFISALSKSFALMRNLVR